MNTYPNEVLRAFEAYIFNPTRENVLSFAGACTNNGFNQLDFQLSPAAKQFRRQRRFARSK